VGKKTKLKYVVADKNVQIKEVKEVVGEEDHYTYISFGANI
jgi:ADP-glucose pyrophosphorylase